MVGEDGGWNSAGLSFLYRSLGWFVLSVWSISFYPQIFLNYRRKSVSGLTVDFLMLNVTKHSAYLIFNASLFFSPVVQKQYREKFGETELIPVVASDVAFSIHAVIITGFTIFQVLIYDSGGQRPSRLAVILSSLAWVSALILCMIAWPKGDWLWLVYCFNLIQLIFTSMKYIPQAYFNYQRKSTAGWSIGNILLDIIGGFANFSQMAIQSIDQNSLQNLIGNVGKVGLSLETVMFDVLFLVQHFLLYPKAKAEMDEYQKIEETELETKPTSDSVWSKSQ